MTVFQYTNFQEYLREWLAQEKQNGRKISFEFLARQLGMRSKGHVHRVFNDATMPLTPRILVRLIEVLNLQGEERDYFEAMVAFNRASSLEERRLFLGRMGRLSGNASAQALDPSACSYLSEWYYPVLREAVCMPDFRGDFRELSKMFVPTLTESQTRRGVEHLITLKLIKGQASGGYISADAYVHAGSEIEAVLVSNFQQQMMKLGSQALDVQPPAKREITTLTFSFPQANFQTIKRALRRLQNELAVEILKEKEPGDTVYQFNMQCFPVFEKGGK